MPVLAEADVVDSGAAGYLCIAMGMYLALTGEIKSTVYKFDSDKSAAALDIDRFTRDSVLEFGYCTEFLLRLTSAKVDPDAFDERTVISELEALGGESIVAFKTQDIIKVHVHTFTPGRVLEACQKYGEFLTLKIENMSVGHTEEPKKKKANKKFSTIAVATGEGICSLFTDMGADIIIGGGQTANPSTEEFVAAFESVDSEYVIVLPNNKNVFLAAKQAAELWDRDRVRIIPTATLMQGYSALSVITPAVTDIDALVAGAERAAASVVSGEITCAVRDVTIDGLDIKKGDYIAITDGKISCASANAEQAVMDMLSSLDMDDYEIITLFVGEGVTSERRADLTERIAEEYPEQEVEVYEGLQPLYDYLLAIE